MGRRKARIIDTNDEESSFDKWYWRGVRAGRLLREFVITVAFVGLLTAAWHFAIKFW